MWAEVITKFKHYYATPKNCRVEHVRTYRKPNWALQLHILWGQWTAESHLTEWSCEVEVQLHIWFQILNMLLVFLCISHNTATLSIISSNFSNKTRIPTRSGNLQILGWFKKDKDTIQSQGSLMVWKMNMAILNKEDVGSYREIWRNDSDKT